MNWTETPSSTEWNAENPPPETILWGTIFNLQRYSTRDGPGIRTTVFFKGCPLRCRWCHNPEGQEERPQLILRPDRCIGCGQCLTICPPSAIQRKADAFFTDRSRCLACGKCSEACPAVAREIVGRQVSVKELVVEVERDQLFYRQSGGGVTFGGGEPLAQPWFLRAILQALRARRIHSAVDTCGLAPTKTVQALVPWVDLWLYDLKVMDRSIHRQYTGQSNDLILENLSVLARLGAPIWVRMPVIPGFNDLPGNVQHTAEFLNDLGLREIHLLSYHASGTEKAERMGLQDRSGRFNTPTEEEMNALAEQFRAQGIQAKREGKS
jgi:pyruvate formate lyase activating enzyme